MAALEAAWRGTSSGARFEPGPVLPAGENKLQLRHVESLTFTSRLGKLQVVQYYEFRI